MPSTASRLRNMPSGSDNSRPRQHPVDGSLKGHQRFCGPRAAVHPQGRTSEGKPFYVNLWPDDVHSPFFPPKALRRDGTKRQLYLGVVKAMDEQFAPLFNYLRASPVLRTNTFLIISSDNGPEPGAGSAGPFRGHKGNLYEGGIREPFIVWAPGFLGPSARGTLNDQYCRQRG